MRLHGSKFKLKTAAFLLLVLILGIHGLKFFHTHEFSFQHYYGQQAHEVLANDPGETAVHCSICDYQLTGNIDTSFVSLEHKLPIFETSFVCFNEQIFTSTHFTLTGRGPPSLLV